MGGPHDYYTEDTGGTGGSWGGGEDFGSPFSGNNSPPATSNEGGNNNWNSNNNNNPWSGNDWANEFVDTGVTVPYDAHAGSSVNNLPNDYTYEGDYVPTFGNTTEDFISAYGGLSYDWDLTNPDFLTLDIHGNPLPDHGDDWYTGGGLWNPFYAGEYPEGHPKAGQPKWLTTSQFNEMMSVGEFGILPPGGATGGGPGPGGGGGYGWGSGGGGGSSRGSGGSRMQFPGAEGDGGMRGRWGQPTIQGDYIRRMRGYNRGGIVSLC
jgi:hypothetical protein